MPVPGAALVCLPCYSRKRAEEERKESKVMTGRGSSLELKASCFSIFYSPVNFSSHSFAHAWSIHLLMHEDLLSVLYVRSCNLWMWHKTLFRLIWEHWKASWGGYRTQHFPKLLNYRTLLEHLLTISQNCLPENTG